MAEKLRKKQQEALNAPPPPSKDAPPPTKDAPPPPLSKDARPPPPSKDAPPPPPSKDSPPDAAAMKRTAEVRDLTYLVICVCFFFVLFRVTLQRCCVTGKATRRRRWRWLVDDAIFYSERRRS